MNVRTLLSKLASVTVLRLGVAVLGFGLFWLLSHRLSATELGGFSLLMNTFMLLQTLPLLGMHVHLIREVAARPEQQSGELAHAMAFAMPVATAMALGLCLFGAMGADVALRWPFLLLGLSMVPTAWVLVAESALIGREQLQVLTTVNMSESAWRMVGALVSLWQGWGLDGVFAFFLVGRFITAAIYATRGGLPRIRMAQVSRAGLQQYLALAPTYLAIGLVSAGHARIDMLVLSRLRDLNEVGIYAAAAKLYEASMMVSTMALMIVYPILSRLFASDRSAFALMLSRSVRWGLLLGAPLVLVGMTLAPALVHLIYLPRLWAAADVLQPLLLAAWLMALDQLLSSTMLAAQAQSQDLRAMVIGLVTLLIGLLVLGPTFGALGTAWAAVAGLAVRVASRLLWAQRELALPGLMLESARSAAAAALGVGVFFALGRHGLNPTMAPWLQGLLALGAALLTHTAAAALTGAFGAQHLAEWHSWRNKAVTQAEVQT
jgi:O-antigen/teichoic acid export membrane protein